MAPFLEPTPDGLYCPDGDFFVDPWAPVTRAVITHAHSDHAAAGSRSYLTAAEGKAALLARLGSGTAIETLPYGHPTTIGGVRVSFHPAGHILGSAQVRLERGGEVWAVSGDYKIESDPTCAPMEPLRCHVFVTESTFGLPIYRWRPQSEVMSEIEGWWRANQQAGKASVLFAYPLGKAQRVLAGVDPSIGPIFAHGAVERFNAIYRAQGVALPQTTHTGADLTKKDWSRALIVAPPSANGTAWMRRFGGASRGFVSGWMRIRGARRRRTLDRGFVLSDHADWPGLLAAVKATGAEKVLVTHGYRGVLVRWLRESGLDAREVDTRFEGERDEAPEELAETGP